MKILLLEDQPDVAQAIAAMLNVDAHDCHWFASTTEAKAACRSESYDFAIVDLELADGDHGSKLLSFLRHEYPATPRVIYSGGAPESIQKWAEFADDILRKPVARKDLHNCLQRLSKPNN